MSEHVYNQCHQFRVHTSWDREMSKMPSVHPRKPREVCRDWSKELWEKNGYMDPAFAKTKEESRPEIFRPPSLPVRP